MVNYSMRGYYEAPDDKVEIEGNVRMDHGELDLIGQSLARGNIRYNLPRVSSVPFSGHVRTFPGNPHLAFVLRPKNTEYIPSLYSLTRTSDEEGGLDGTYVGAWTPLAPELVDQLSDNPPFEEIRKLFQLSREKYGTAFQRTEITLTMGKIARKWQATKRKVKETISSLLPQPEPVIS